LSALWPIPASVQLAQKRLPLRHDALGQIFCALFQSGRSESFCALWCVIGIDQRLQGQKWLGFSRQRDKWMIWFLDRAEKGPAKERR